MKVKILDKNVITAEDAEKRDKFYREKNGMSFEEFQKISPS